MLPQTGLREGNFHTENGITSRAACRVIISPEEASFSASFQLLVEESTSEKMKLDLGEPYPKGEQS